MRRKDEALQLLLIIDYILDWARDKYRNDVLSQLKSLAQAEFEDTDSDIVSMRLPLDVQDRGGSPKDIDDDQTNDDTEYPRNNALHGLSSKAFTIRNISYIESEFLGLLVTRDSLNTMLQAFGEDLQSRRIAKKIVKAVVREPIIFTGKQLGDLEALWTGERPSRTTDEVKFRTKMSFRFWMADEWAPTRRLTCLAVAEDALDQLEELTKSARRRKDSRCEFDWKYLQLFFESIATASMNFNLLAAIERLSLGVVVRPQSSHPHCAHPWVPPETPRKWFGLERETSGFLVDTVVLNVYRRHCIGRREPSESYIRRSNRTDEQTLSAESAVDPYEMDGSLQFTREGYVAVDGDSTRHVYHNYERSNCCLLVPSAAFESLTSNAVFACIAGLMLDNIPVHQTLIFWGRKAVSSIKWNMSTYTCALPQEEDWTRGFEAFLRHLSVAISDPLWSTSIFSNAPSMSHLRKNTLKLLKPHHSSSSDEENSPISFELLLFGGGKRRGGPLELLLDQYSLKYLARLCRWALRFCPSRNPAKALARLSEILDAPMTDFHEILATTYIDATSREVEDSVDSMITKMMTENGVSASKVKTAMAKLRRST